MIRKSNWPFSCNEERKECSSRWATSKIEICETASTQLERRDAVQTHTINVIDGMSDCWHAVDIVSGTRIARIICSSYARRAFWNVSPCTGGGPGIQPCILHSNTLKKLTSGERNALLRVPLL